MVEWTASPYGTEEWAADIMASKGWIPVLGHMAPSSVTWYKLSIPYLKCLGLEVFGEEGGTTGIFPGTHLRDGTQADIKFIYVSEIPYRQTEGDFVQCFPCMF